MENYWQLLQRVAPSLEMIARTDQVRYVVATRKKHVVRCAIVGGGIWLASMPSHAGTWLEHVNLLSMQQGSSLSDTAYSLGKGGLELQAGEAVDLKKWYRTRWTDVHVSWLVVLQPETGLIVGLSTGERGEKYFLQPSLKLGLLHNFALTKSVRLSFSASTIIGGKLVEKPCVADYGDVGGIQKVNCRLAASTLPPEETLKYLVNKRPDDRIQAKLTLNWFF